MVYIVNDTHKNMWYTTNLNNCGENHFSSKLTYTDDWRTNTNYCEENYSSALERFKKNVERHQQQ